MKLIINANTGHNTLQYIDSVHLLLLILAVIKFGFERDSVILTDFLTSCRHDVLMYNGNFACPYMYPSTKLCEVHRRCRGSEGC